MVVSNPVSVLVVDDKRRKLIALKAALADADHRATVAHSGADADAVMFLTADFCGCTAPKSMAALASD